VVGLIGPLAKPVIQMIFDSSYGGAAAVIWPVLLSAGTLALVMILVQYLLALGESLPACVPWFGVVGFTALTILFHSSIHAIADAMLGATAVTAVVLIAVSIHGLRYLQMPERAVLEMADLGADIDLTVVVPYYNPGTLLGPNLCRLLHVLDRSPLSWEVIAVSDGSTDGSPLTIQGLGEERLHHVVLPRNQGKGAALRAGMVVGRGRYLGFIDADGDLDPKLLASFIDLVEGHDPEIVVGSKRHPSSEVHYPPLRRLYSLGYQCVVRMLFRLNVRDTQTGLKLLRRDVLAAALPRMLEKRFAFDLELLVVARRLGFRRVIETPIVLNHQFKSTVSFRSVLDMLVDTAAIFYRLRIVRTYDRVPGASARELRLVPAFLRGAAVEGPRPVLAPAGD
jgi:glycosyltransferase involved in cell wall biosynthesis